MSLLDMAEEDMSEVDPAALSEAIDAHLRARCEAEFDYYTGTSGAERLDVLAEEAAPLAGIVVGHLDTDDPTLRSLARWGAVELVAEASRPARLEVSRRLATTAIRDGGEPVTLATLRTRLLEVPPGARRDSLESAQRLAFDARVWPAYEQLGTAVNAAMARLGCDAVEYAARVLGLDVPALEAEALTFVSETDTLYRDLVMRGRSQPSTSVVDLLREINSVTAPSAEVGRGAISGRALFERAVSRVGVRSEVFSRIDIREGVAGSPPAFCAPLDPPRRVGVVVRHGTSAETLRALFHELGHAIHYTHVDPSLPVVRRRMGDLAVSEGWAMIFEWFLSAGEWLAAFDLPRRLADDGALRLLIVARAQSARLLYEAEVARMRSLPSASSLAKRYDELMAWALHAMPGRTEFARDLFTGFSSALYLRAWGFAAAAWAGLERSHGCRWFLTPAAGETLRSAWSVGAPLDASEVLGRLSSDPLSLRGVATSLAQRLAAHGTTA